MSNSKYEGQGIPVIKHYTA